MVNILLSGADGAMGKVLTELVEENEKFFISAGLARTYEELEDFVIYDDINNITEDVDVIIDFSSKDNLNNLLKYAEDNNLPLILATTGYDEKDMENIRKASESIPLVQSGNFSLGVHVMVYVSKILAGLLDDFDIEIIEKHHNKKKDAPSGTANMIYDAVNQIKDHKLKKVYGRHGFTDKKDKNEVGMHSLRAGTINGEHEIIFAGEDEVITLSHSASSKRIFALGSLKAAEYLIGKDKGMFDFDEILGIG
ncbi:MAG: 4-hydroxy-tetrahydrodipicolinate reductase [Peptoniphilus sp.]|nr:4-hydroxy-tetrahydrodipicolinate reductase [Peptoniphilus sp.]MDD7362862.1 4-hydroxy-tetrahydrodipicolinate reductase [Bacillota bacterium]MDY6043946.1 4-hydroxy-tetrahydrodipicolinate reductase [Peptoniphilus sp.]